MRGAIPAFLLAIPWLVALACPGTAAGKCREDGDCTGALLCRGGRCVTVQCRTDAHCPAGRMCRDELCRIRQCYVDMDCSIDRRCDRGSCVLPPPPRLRGPRVPGALRLAVGPLFPVGFQGLFGLPVGARRWIEVGLGSTLIDGGLSWRLGLRGTPVVAEHFELEVWAGAMGLHAGPMTGFEGSPPRQGPSVPLHIALGSGRPLFARGRDIEAVWWGAGASVVLPLDRAGEHRLRADIGLLLLYGDRYPARADYALLPAFGIAYGRAIPPDSAPRSGGLGLRTKGRELRGPTTRPGGGAGSLPPALALPAPGAGSGRAGGFSGGG